MSSPALHTIAIPRAMLRAPERFGGQQDGALLRGAAVIREGRLVGLRTAEPVGPCRMVIPALTEAHCHLDKCHTIGRMSGIGGDLMAAIAAQAEDKANWTEDDLRQRCTKGLRELIAAGCQTVRSHVDWGDGTEPPIAFHVLSELAQTFRGQITIQIAALTGIDQLARPGFADAVARVLAPVGGVLGGFLLHHAPADQITGLRASFAAADRYGLMLDFHVDEGLADGLDGLLRIAQMKQTTGYGGSVLCGHACSLMNSDGTDLRARLDAISTAGLHIVSLPTTNLYLQGRCAGSPDRRGLTRLQELHAAGVPIIVGSDNVADAFCPLGQHDPMAALHLGCLAGHLDPPLERWLPAVTTDARKALGLSAGFIEDLPLDALRISPAEDMTTLVSGRLGPPVPIREVEETVPA